MRRLALLSCVFAGFGLFLMGCSSSGSDPDPLILHTEYDAAVALMKVSDGVYAVHEMAHDDPLGGMVKTFVNHSGKTLAGNEFIAGAWAKVSAARSASMALALDIDPVLGECGGTKTITGTENDLDGTVYVIYDNYDDCGVVQDGKFTYSWRDYDDGTGYERATYTGYTERDSSTGDLIQRINGKSYLDWDDTGAYFTETISTTITHEDQYGTSGFYDTIIAMTFQDLMYTYDMQGHLKVDGKAATLDTPVIMESATDTEAVPYLGEMTLNGDGKVRVTFLGDDMVQVEVDADEDGTYEYDQTKSWADWQAIAAD